MAALLLTYTNSLSEQIPATILGLILDGIIIKRKINKFSAFLIEIKEETIQLDTQL